MNLIYRAIVTEIKNQIESGNVIILTGARQVGKTSILKLLIKETETVLPKTAVFYFDLEKEEFLEIFQSHRALEDWLKLQGADLNKKLYLFIDEFHYIPNPTKLFKIIHDSWPKVRIVATGSSSLEISHKIKEGMTGRKRIFHISGLTFEEYLEFKQSSQRQIFGRLKNSPGLNLTGVVLSEFIREWEEFLLFGGYPKIALTQGAQEKAKELAEIYNWYIEKDIKAFLKLENVIAFNRLVKILAAQNGSLANLSQVGSPLGIARETLERYLFVLKNTFVVKGIPPFFTNKGKEIVKMEKIFFCDTGLRNFGIKDFRELELRADKGALVENGAMSELNKGLSALQEIHFWRTQAKTEVDFILVNEGGELLPIEVKYRSFNAPRIPSGLKAFIVNHKARRAFVLTKDYTGKTIYEACRVYFMPVFMSSFILNRNYQAGFVS